MTLDNAKDPHDPGQESLSGHNQSTSRPCSGAMPLGPGTPSDVRLAVYGRAQSITSRRALNAIGLFVAGFSALFLNMVTTCSGEEYISKSGCWIAILGVDLFLLLIGLPFYFQLGKSIRKHEAFIDSCIASVSNMALSHDLRTLLRLQEIGHHDLQAAVITRVTPLIDCLEPGDNGGVTPGEWKLWLEVGTDWQIEPSPLLVAIIKLFERNRDPAAIDVIRRFAKSGAWLVNSQAVQQAAIESLPALEAALLQLKQRETLLRPSGPVSIPAQELLRAASPANSTPPEVLLRPSSPYDRPL